VVGVHSQAQNKWEILHLLFGFDAEYVLHYLSNVFDIFFLFLNKIKNNVIETAEKKNKEEKPKRVDGDFGDFTISCPGSVNS
jgi:hypothetical protein